MTSQLFQDYLSAQRDLIDQALDSFSADFGDGCPGQLSQAMRYSLLLPGKRIRPILTLMAADVCDGKVEDALSAACSVEMIHAFSLIHDDLPAMDDDDMRRDKPSNHKVFGEAQAILAGDGLLAFAFDLLTRTLPAEKAATCVSILARATGPAGMTGGQSEDIADPSTSLRMTAKSLDLLHARKTGALITASLEMGAVIAEASDDDRLTLVEYGKAIGLAFQITDDLLDHPEDSDEGRPSYPALLGVEESKTKVAELTNLANASVEQFGEKGWHLKELALYIRDRVAD